MDIRKTIEVFGDSILRGIQINPRNKRYCIDNHIGIDAICKRFSVSIYNRAQFGHTISKGEALLKSRLDAGLECDMVVMDYGGNDCDFNWKAIAERPDDDHQPNTPLNLFTETYLKMIDMLKERGIKPILTTLPPIDPQRFFNWFCAGLGAEHILKWLGDINAIYRYQEMYSRAVEKIALTAKVSLVDLRGAFLAHRKLGGLLCEDGIHPSTSGQGLITEAFVDFAEQLVAART